MTNRSKEKKNQWKIKNMYNLKKNGNYKISKQNKFKCKTIKKLSHSASWKKYLFKKVLLK